MTALKTQAIQTALMGDWETAISLNQTILQDSPDDIDTLNRLAYAYASQGDIKEAKNIYQKVLDLDTQNPIALRNLKRLSVSNGKAHLAPMNISNLFIEEPGKTKVIELLNIADKKVISPLRSGERLTLSVKRMKIFVLDEEKQYIGMLPDDLGKRLIKFIESGNTYEAYVKSVENNKVTIFARETSRAKSLINQASFISTDKHKKFTFDPHHEIDEDTIRKHAESDEDGGKNYSNDDDDSDSL